MKEAQFSSWLCTTYTAQKFAQCMFLESLLYTKMGWWHGKRNGVTVLAYSAFLAPIPMWIWFIKYLHVEKQAMKRNCNSYQSEHWAEMKRVTTVWWLSWDIINISKSASCAVVAVRTDLDLLFPWISLNRCMDGLLDVPPTWSGSRTKECSGFGVLLAICYNTQPSLMSDLSW